MSISRVAVVGAGILGVATAREIAARFPDAELTVIDKADDVAAHQSGHTTGIVDSGLDRIPGSAEAELAHRGVELLVPFVSERGIPYRECGQLMVAQNTDEADRLEEIFARAKDNGIPGVRLLERKEMSEVEPEARGVLGLYSPHAAVTDFGALTGALASDVSAAGGTFRFATEVTGFDIMSNEVRIRGRATAADEQVDEAPRTYYGNEDTRPVVDFGEELRSRFGGQDWFRQVEGTLHDWTEKFSSSWSGGGRGEDHRGPADQDGSGGGAGADTRGSGDDSTGSGKRARREMPETTIGTFDLVFVCAGLQADRLAAAAGLEADPRIVPFTSDYYEIPAASAEAVRGIIGSVPDPDAPFAETGMVRGVNGSLMLGPNTFVSLGREKYDRRGFDLGDMGSTAKFTGFWKFAAQTARTAAHGAKTTVSRKAFIDSVEKYVPTIDGDSVETGPRGVRAQAMNSDGELLDELIIATRGRLTAVRAVPRWGATSALAIAERIVGEAAGARGR
ncbi:FAD-dependent oxidoreductase [Brevibacterium sp. S111]|uniref:FAD-dependent oxidoreductase n=1 Tax=Brevibacterium sp. S111 TaxID=2483795 RepID=UPI001F0CECA1|nr:FAD-dependent oxidoreductase [Brevibacterium sp. S111]